MEDEVGLGLALRGDLGSPARLPADLPEPVEHVGLPVVLMHERPAGR